MLRKRKKINLIIFSTSMTQSINFCKIMTKTCFVISIWRNVNQMTKTRVFLYHTDSSLIRIWKFLWRKKKWKEVRKRGECINWKSDMKNYNNMHFFHLFHKYFFFLVTQSLTTKSYTNAPCVVYLHNALFFITQNVCIE